MEKPDATVEPLQHAGFWIRVAAWMIDLVAVAVPLAGIYFVLVGGDGSLGRFPRFASGDFTGRASPEIRSGLCVRVPGIFCRDGVALFRAAREFAVASYAGKAFPGIVCGQCRRPAHRFLASQRAVPLWQIADSRAGGRGILFSGGLRLHRFYATEAGHPRHGRGLFGFAGEPAKLFCSWLRPRALRTREGTRPPVRPPALLAARPPPNANPSAGGAA